MKLITLSGLDGSGKSTQIELLKNHLESQSKRVFYFHAIEFSLAKKIIDFRNKYCLLCRLIGKCRVKNGASRANEPAAGVTKANVFQIFLRKLFLRIDLWRFGLLRNKLHNKGYDYILSDRYFYDSLINIDYLKKSFHCERSETIPPSPATPCNDIPKPDISFYLSLSPNDIMQRARKPDQGLEYLEKKYKLYEEAAGCWQMKTVSGNRSKEEIFEEIKKIIP